MRISGSGEQRLVAPSADPHFDGSAQSLLTGTLPNGLAFSANVDNLI